MEDKINAVIDAILELMDERCSPILSHHLEAALDALNAEKGFYFSASQ